MKSLIACALVACLMGCGSAPDTNENKSVGFVPPSTGDGKFDNSNESSQVVTCGEYRVVTVWIDGVPTPQLQPVLCNRGPNFNIGDPGPDKGDPNPWEANGVFKRGIPVMKAGVPSKM